MDRPVDPVARTPAAIWKLPGSAREIHHLASRDDHDGVMACNFVTPERGQLYLLLPSLTDWLPEDHLARLVLDCVDEMDLTTFYADYRKDGWGGAAHHPKTMVALFVYAYCLGVRSSRQIDSACRVDIAFRVICAGLFPDHTTIARFRVRHADAQFGDARGDEPPATLRGRADRRRRFRAAKELLDKELTAERKVHEAHLAERAAEEGRRGKKLRGRKPKAPKDKAGAKGKKVSTTDPCSKIMSTAKGFLHGDNAQAVANEAQVIVAAAVTDCQ